MKRSEVINVMVDRFKSGDIPEPYMWANDILDILERRIGMLPPPIENPDRKQCVKESYYIHEWEPEDV